jgi:hypothetical protein
VSEVALVVDLNSGDLQALQETTLQEVGVLERRDLQRWITDHPELVGDGLLLITSEFDRWELRDQRVEDRLDVLFLTESGSLLVAELKRDRASDTTDLQALKYAAFYSTFTVDDVIEEYQRFHKVSAEDARASVCSHAPQVEEEGVGEVLIRLVAGSFGPAVTSVVLWLRDYGLDIGCVQLTARLLEGESALITGRQLLPLPVTEDYVVRRRRREQEQEERTRRNRGANTVQVLADAGILEPGTTIHVGLDALVGAWRPAVEEFIASHPDAALAEWNGETTARSMRWHYDGELYSLTSLTKALLEAAGINPPDSIPGPDYWLLPDDRVMYRTSVEVRENL